MRFTQHQVRNSSECCHTKHGQYIIDSNHITAKHRATEPQDRREFLKNGLVLDAATRTSVRAEASHRPPGMSTTISDQARRHTSRIRPPVRLTPGVLKLWPVTRPTFGDRSRFLGTTGGVGNGPSDPPPDVAGDSSRGGVLLTTDEPLVFFSPIPFTVNGFSTLLLKACLHLRSMRLQKLFAWCVGWGGVRILANETGGMGSF